MVAMPGSPHPTSAPTRTPRFMLGGSPGMALASSNRSRPPADARGAETSIRPPGVQATDPPSADRSAPHEARTGDHSSGASSSRTYPRAQLPAQAAASSRSSDSENVNAPRRAGPTATFRPPGSERYARTRWAPCWTTARTAPSSRNNPATMSDWGGIGHAPAGAIGQLDDLHGVEESRGDQDGAADPWVDPRATHRRRRRVLRTGRHEHGDEGRERDSASPTRPDRDPSTCPAAPVSPEPNPPSHTEAVTGQFRLHDAPLRPCRRRHRRDGSYAARAGSSSARHG